MSFRSLICAVIIFFSIQLAGLSQDHYASLKVKVLLPGGLTTSGIHVIVHNTINDLDIGQFTNDEGVCLFKKLNPQMKYYVTTGGCPYRPFKGALLTLSPSHIEKETAILEPVDNYQCECLSKPGNNVSLAGILTDEYCDPIQGADIVLTKRDELIAKAMTDKNGCFCFTDISPYDHYTLGSEPEGYSKTIIHNISIESNKCTIIRMWGHVGFPEFYTQPQPWWRQFLNVKGK